MIESIPAALNAIEFVTKSEQDFIDTISLPCYTLEQI
jgi:hypothetical protein